MAFSLLMVDEFVIFDIETTGLSAINDSITEIGAIKVKDGEVIDTFSHLVNPERPIPEFITKLTGITDEMVEDKPTIEKIIPLFHDFIMGSILIAHNASFDVGFIRENLKRANLKFSNPVLDTLELSRAVFPDLKNHKLNTLSKYLDIKLVVIYFYLMLLVIFYYLYLLGLLFLHMLNQISFIYRC